MHLVVIAWLYVVLMMSLSEAFSVQGSVLGAIITFVLYGVLPLSIVVYVMGTPARKKALRHQQACNAMPPIAKPSDGLDPDTCGHSPSLPPPDGVSPVREIQPGL